MKKRIGVIDLGSNSIRLLLANIDSKEVIPLRRELFETRLGEGLRSGHKLSNAAKERTRESFRSLIDLLAKEEADEIVAAATSAVREAVDGAEFVEEIESEFSIPVQVLSAEEEAYYGFKGVEFALKYLSSLKENGIEKEFPGIIGDQLIVLDLGGRSTELSWNENGGFGYYSLPFGAVSLHEAFFAGTYSPQRGAAELREYLLKLFYQNIEGATQEKIHNKELSGIGGTVTTLAALEAGLKEYNPDRVHGTVLYKDQLRLWESFFLNSSIEERRILISFAPKRADIILAGTSALLAVMDFLGKDYIVVSEGGTLWGLLLSVPFD